MSKLKQRGIEVYNWFEHRLGLAKPIVEAAEHPIPASSASWWYVFGSAATVLLGLQVVTGILLALVYVPSASEAWNSLAVPQSQRHPGLVSARHPRLGLRLHDRHRAHPHGAGLSLRRL